MKLKVFCLILVFLLTSQVFAGDVLHPFETDYCTSFPEGTKEEPMLWAHCCLEHDLYFWAGGTKEERDEVDLNLKACVEETGQEHIAKLMYLGVTLGQLSPIKFETRKWGNAWGEERKYESLTKEEIVSIKESLNDSSDLIPENILNRFLNNLDSRME